MHRIIRIVFGVFIWLFSTNGHSQGNLTNTGRTHRVSFKTQFIQIKDEFNYGLVYSGPNLAAAYTYLKISDNNVLMYSPEITFGSVFNKGAGFAWRFKPIDLFYGRSSSSKPFTIGAYFSADYQWQQYSELQGGRLFWFSAIEIGPRIAFDLPYKSYSFNISFSNSLAGVTSRPEPSTERYFYSFSFSEFFSVAHQNPRFGSYNQFNRTKLGAEIRRDSWKRFSMEYCFEYFGYYKEPKLGYSGHSVSFNWKF